MSLNSACNCCSFAVPFTPFFLRDFRVSKCSVWAFAGYSGPCGDTIYNDPCTVYKNVERRKDDGTIIARSTAYIGGCEWENVPNSSGIGGLYNCYKDFEYGDYSESVYDWFNEGIGPQFAHGSNPIDPETDCDFERCQEWKVVHGNGIWDYRGFPDLAQNNDTRDYVCLSRPYDQTEASIYPPFDTSSEATSYNLDLWGVKNRVDCKYKIYYSMPSSCYLKIWLKKETIQYEEIFDNCGRGVNWGGTPTVTSEDLEPIEITKSSTPCLPNPTFLYNGCYNLEAMNEEGLSFPEERGQVIRIYISKWSCLEGYEPTENDNTCKTNCTPRTWYYDQNFEITPC